MHAVFGFGGGTKTGRQPVCLLAPRFPSRHSSANPTRFGRFVSYNEQHVVCSCRYVRRYFVIEQRMPPRLFAFFPRLPHPVSPVGAT